MLLKEESGAQGRESNHRHCDFQSHAHQLSYLGIAAFAGPYRRADRLGASHFGDFGQAHAATRGWLIKEFGSPLSRGPRRRIAKNSILRILGDLIQIRLFVRRHPIAFGQPLPKVQIGAALGTEGPVVLEAGLPQIGHARP